MNYIKQLQEQVAADAAIRADVRQQMTGLLVYLQSPKFHNDPTVQVAEIARIVMDWRTQLSD